MSSKTLRMTLALTAALFLAAAVAPGVQAQQFKAEYRLTLNVGPAFYWGMGGTKFTELVKEKTKGKINLKPYYSSELLKGAQLNVAQMVAKGVIDCAMESTINVSTVIPEANVFHLPFFINGFEKLDKMKAGGSGQAVFAAFEKLGLKPLAWGENGFRQLTNSKKAVLKPEDLKGLRIRVVGNPLFVDIFRQLGADPVNMNWADAVAGFQQGVVDGQENPVGVIVPLQVFQYHKYATFWNYLVDPLVFFWNKEQWAAFPPDIQKAITAAAVEAGRFEIALCRAGLDGDKSINVLKNEFKHTMEVAEPVKYLESKGMTVTNLKADQVKAFVDATKPVLDKYISQVGQEVVNKAKADMGQ
ncbi:MAG: DctP family TRAP transporter solute-binding subunit [Thermodesulfobacteriota bacterium]